MYPDIFAIYMPMRLSIRCHKGKESKGGGGTLPQKNPNNSPSTLNLSEEHWEEVGASRPLCPCHPSCFLVFQFNYLQFLRLRRYLWGKYRKLHCQIGWYEGNVSGRQVPKPLEIVLRWREVINKETGTRWGGWLIKNSVLCFHVEGPYSWHRGESLSAADIPLC